MANKEPTVAHLFPAPSRRDLPELLDDPRSVLRDLPANLGDIRRLNRWFGGTAVVLSYLDRLLPRQEPARILDVATGSADIPLAIWHWGARSGIQLDIVAVDISTEILAEAQRTVGEVDIRLVQADARSLPWPDASFDVVTCSLALHHFSPAEAQRVLTEMWRVSKRSILVVDLVRSLPAYAGAWLSTRTVARNHLTRHDAPLSVLRSYTVDELYALAHDAGLRNICVRRQAFFRQSLVARKDDSRAP